MVENNKHAYINAHDVEDADQHSFAAGVWRNDPPLIGLSASSGRNATQCATQSY